MSIGLQFLHALVQAQSHNQVREMRPEWFVENEMPAYEAFMAHYRQHGACPSEEALARRGVQLVASRDSPGYYADLLRRRGAYNSVVARTQAFNHALASQDMDVVGGVLREMLASVAVVQRDAGVRLTSLATEAQRVLENYQIAKVSPGLRGVTLGYGILDELTDGAQPGDLIYLVGRPSLGKSYKMMEMSRRAWASGHPVLMCSMEMSLEQITQRMIGMTSGVMPSLIRKGRLSMWTERDVYSTVRGYQGLPPYHLLSGDFRKTVDDLDMMIQQCSPDIVYIDAAYLLSPSVTRQSNRRAKWEALAEVMEDLKRVAINRAVPLVLSVQFSRQVKVSAKKEPDLADIGGTDVIGQIATLVLALSLPPGAGTMRGSTRRMWTVIKNREGELARFFTNFRFSPINFDYIGLVDEVREETPDMSHMI